MQKVKQDHICLAIGPALCLQDHGAMLCYSVLAMLSKDRHVLLHYTKALELP